MSITCPSRLAMLLNFLNSVAVINLAAAVCSDTSWLFRSLSKIHSDSPLVFAQPRSFNNHVHYLAGPSRLAMLLNFVNSFAVINLAAAVFSDTSWLFRSLSKIHSDSPLVFAQPRSFKSNVHYLAGPRRLAMLLNCVNSFAIINLAAAVFSDTSWLFRSFSKIHFFVFAQPRSFKNHVHYLAGPSRLAMLLFCQFLCCH